MMKYDAVLFDLDGTLLDTLEDLADATNAALTAHGFPAHPVEAYRYFVGDGVRVLMERTLPPDRQDEATIRAVTDTYRQAYGRNWNAKTRPYAGVPEMLDSLTARGLALAVLSNKPDEFTRQCVSALLPRWRFAAVQGAAAGLPHKPDPAGALAIARRLGVAPARFLYLGDTATDMRTACAAGMLAVGALWGFRTRQELEGAGARMVLDRPEGMLKLLG